MPTNILIVDDDLDVRETLTVILESEDYQVTTAENGREALQVLAAPGRPSVILLDLRMPEMDGWQVIETLRARGALAEIPIVICTSAPYDAPPGFPVVAKPIDLDDLLAKLSKARG
jgi:CheY-like chemotaxis protein